jgi:hypothetical protein
VVLLFVSVQSKHRISLFWYRSETKTTETNCFEKNEEKTKKKKKKEKKRKNRENLKFSVKNCKICSLSNCFGWSSVCFGSIETSKLSVLNRSETTETNVLFWIVPKLVSVPVSVVSNRN